MAARQEEVTSESIRMPSRCCIASTVFCALFNFCSLARGLVPALSPAWLLTHRHQRASVGSAGLAPEWSDAVRDVDDLWRRIRRRLERRRQRRQQQAACAQAGGRYAWSREVQMKATRPVCTGAHAHCQLSRMACPPYHRAQRQRESCERLLRSSGAAWRGLLHGCFGGWLEVVALV